MKEDFHISRSPEDTWKLAAEILGHLPRTAVLALHGDLGSGKTCFVQGLAHAMGIPRAITSPTFTIINEYPGDRPLYHVDLYRLAGLEETYAFGFEEYLAPDGITAIEWAEKAGGMLPPETVHIHFICLPEADSRSISIRWPS